ncbi:MAG TPA: Plug domain-containing protein, partial [Gemmatimonadaceae bacterium]|nr:Plug domain-containing protein [Gemmatimonadaceae bacterium]
GARIIARRLGYRPMSAELTVAEGRTVLPLVMHTLASETLDTVVITDDAQPLARHAEVEARRRNREATASITRADIIRHNPAETWQMLTNVPAIRIVDIDTMVVARSARTTTIANYKNDYCYMLVTVDGVLLNKDSAHSAFDLRFLPRPEDVEAIEVFAGAASIPVKYGGAGDGKWCGLIAIWTR